MESVKIKLFPQLHQIIRPDLPGSLYEAMFMLPEFSSSSRAVPVMLADAVLMGSAGQ